MIKTSCFKNNTSDQDSRQAKMVLVTTNTEVISREIIKPSSSTPQHLRNLKLSFLDQLANRFYIPIIFFYDQTSEKNPHTDDHLLRSCLLKKSLAECLTRFYPLAGRIRENISVDCNDEGVEFKEVRVGCKLSEAIETANVKLLKQLLPFEPYGRETQVPFGVQFNIFDCGRMAIAVCVSHKIADGTSVASFMNAWAAMSRVSTDQTEQYYPIFDSAVHFPPRDVPGFKHETETMEEKIASKRFVFDKLKIAALRERASSSFLGSQVKAPTTRVQAVSALIWERFMAIISSKSGSGKTCVAVHAVNLRDRLTPPLPNHFFGNLWRQAFAPTTIQGKKDYGMLVNMMGNSIRQIDGDYAKKLKIDNGGIIDSLKNASEEFSKGETEFFGFTSWCRFPLYEVDFGWGKPTWVCSPLNPYKNMAVLMSTKEGDGIEAWVNLLKEDMVLFERDPELLSFISSMV